MILRIAYFAALLMVALLTIGLQLDRAARTHPELAEWTPPPLRSGAQAAIARKAQREGAADRALEDARTLVARRPVPAEHLTLLALAEATAGDPRAGARTLEIAGTRGWREPLAQEAMARIALANGDGEAAALRLIALMLRPQTPAALLEDIAAATFASSRGEAVQAVGEIVAAGERWQGQYLRRGAASFPPRAFADATARAIASGARFDCPSLQTAQRILLAREEPESEAFAPIVAAQCR
jgi:hypothetical protein